MLWTSLFVACRSPLTLKEISFKFVAIVTGRNKLLWNVLNHRARYRRTCVVSPQSQISIRASVKYLVTWRLRKRFKQSQSNRKNEQTSKHKTRWICLRLKKSDTNIKWRNKNGRSLNSGSPTETSITLSCITTSIHNRFQKENCLSYRARRYITC